MQKSVDKNFICVEILELNGCVSQHVLYHGIQKVIS